MNGNFKAVNIQIMSEKSSTFFEKHTKCCTFTMFTHNIYSRKGVSYRRLRKKEELINLDDFLWFLSKKVEKEKLLQLLLQLQYI